MGKKSRRAIRVMPLSPEIMAAREAGKVITVTRKEAMARLLDTAIALWALEQDPLCIHLLIFGPYHCLEAIGGKSGKGPVLLSRSDRAKYTLAYDFLRHASSKLNETLDFPPMANPVLLFDAIGAFERICGISTASMRTFTAYFMNGFVPDIELTEEALHGGPEFLPEGLSFEEASKWTRIEFFARVSKEFAKQS